MVDDKTTRKERRRKEQGPTEDTLHQLRQLWEQIYIFEHSDGDKERQNPKNYKSEIYAEFLNGKRFKDPQGAYKELQRLLQLKSYSGLRRARKIQESAFGDVLAISYFRDGKYRLGINYWPFFHI